MSVKPKLFRPFAEPRFLFFDPENRSITGFVTGHRRTWMAARLASFA